MIGRGSYGRPWFVRQVADWLRGRRRLPDPPLSAQLGIVLGHCDDMPTHYGTELGARIARTPQPGDSVWPPAITRASYKHQQHSPGVTEMVEMPGRGHALTIDSRWHEVADAALAFVQRFTSPQPARTEPAGS